MGRRVREGEEVLVINHGVADRHKPAEMRGVVYDVDPDHVPAVVSRDGVVIHRYDEMGWTYEQGYHGTKPNKEYCYYLDMNEAGQRWHESTARWELKVPQVEKPFVRGR